MAKSEATTVDAGGREVRVSNPDRVIFPATERTPEVTKLEIAEYYLAVEDGIMRSLHRRPTTLERWPKGVHPGIVLSTREKGGGDAFYQKRIPRGAPDYVETARIEFPSGRHADEICPTEIAVVAWCAADGDDHLPPVARALATTSIIPDELRIDLDPQPGTDFEDAVRVAGEARTLLDDLGYVGFPKTSGGRGIHIYVRIEPRWTFTDVRHAAIAFGRELERRMPGRGDDEVVEGGARRARVHRLQPERARPDDRLGLQRASQAGRDGVRAAGVGRGREVQPEDLTVATMPVRFADGRRPPRGDRRRGPLPRAAARDVRARRGAGAGDMPYPPDYPKMPGEPKRVQPSRDRDRKR